MEEFNDNLLMYKYIVCYINVREKQKGQSLMKKKKLATLGSQNTRRKQTKQKTQ